LEPIYCYIVCSRVPCLSVVEPKPLAATSGQARLIVAFRGASADLTLTPTMGPKDHP
jgi:hypothetical protein